MSDDQPERPAPDVSDYAREIRDLVVEIKTQNILLRRYLFVFASALCLLLLMQFESVRNLLGFAIQIVLVVIMVMAVLLTAPWWSQLAVQITERASWWTNRKGADAKAAEKRAEKKEEALR